MLCNKGEKSGGSDGDDEGEDGDDDFDNDSDDNSDGRDKTQMDSDKQVVAYEAWAGYAGTSYVLSRAPTTLPSPSSSYYKNDEMARSLCLTPLLQKFVDSSLPVSESREIVVTKTLSDPEKKWIHRKAKDFDKQ